MACLGILKNEIHDIKQEQNRATIKTKSSKQIRFRIQGRLEDFIMYN